MPPNSAQRRKVSLEESCGETPAAWCLAPAQAAPRTLAMAAAVAAPRPVAGPLLFDALPSDVSAELLDLIPVEERLALRLICKGWQRWLNASARAWAEVRRQPGAASCGQRQRRQPGAACLGPARRRGPVSRSRARD